MAATKRASALNLEGRSRRAPAVEPAVTVSAPSPAHAAVLEEARRAGLLDGDKMAGTHEMHEKYR